MGSFPISHKCWLQRCTMPQLVFFLFVSWRLNRACIGSHCQPIQSSNWQQVCSRRFKGVSGPKWSGMGSQKMDVTRHYPSASLMGHQVTSPCQFRCWSFQTKSLDTLQTSLEKSEESEVFKYLVRHSVQYSTVHPYH